MSQHEADTERIAKMEATLELVAEGLRMLVQRVNDVAAIAQNVARMQERQDHQAATLDNLRDRLSSLEMETPKIREKLTNWISVNRGFVMTISVVSTILGWVFVHQITEYEDQLKTTREQLVTLDRRMAWVDYVIRREAKDIPEPIDSGKRGN